MKKTNKRFGGLTSEGMEIYDEIASLVICDQSMNREMEIEYKDLMYQNMYGNKGKNATYCSYCDFI